MLEMLIYLSEDTYFGRELHCSPQISLIIHKQENKD